MTSSVIKCHLQKIHLYIDIDILPITFNHFSINFFKFDFFLRKTMPCNFAFNFCSTFSHYDKYVCVMQMFVRIIYSIHSIIIILFLCNDSLIVFFFFFWILILIFNFIKFKLFNELRAWLMRQIDHFVILCSIICRIIWQVSNLFLNRWDRYFVILRHPICLWGNIR